MKTLDVGTIEHIGIRMAKLESKIVHEWSVDEFRNPEVLKLISEWHELKEERIRLIRDLESCNSKDPDDMCRSCNCWKATRANCS